jgi:choice-of-anchor A domain-containing protein/MYXO-CTERM domain-containing protein
MVTKSLIATALALSCLGAQAAPVLTDFNAFVFGNFNSKSSDSEGNLVVGGNFTANGYSINSMARQGPRDPAAVVGGTLSLTNGQANGDVYAGAGIVLSSAGVIGTQHTGPNDVGFLRDWQGYYTTLSSTYGQQAATGAVEQKWGGLYFTGKAGAGTTTFLVTTDMVKNAGYWNFAGLDAGQRVVLNFSGGSFDLFNMDLSQTLGKYDVLMNFLDATNVSFTNTSPDADILAPFATIHGSNGHVQGTLVAGSYDSTLELHESAPSFLAPPPASTPSTPNSIPEPGSLALALGGLFMAWQARRRVEQARMRAVQ